MIPFPSMQIHMFFFNCFSLYYVLGRAQQKWETPISQTQKTPPYSIIDKWQKQYNSTQTQYKHTNSTPHFVRNSVTLNAWNAILCHKCHAIECHYKKAYQRHRLRRLEIKARKRSTLYQRKCKTSRNSNKSVV